MNKQSTGKRTFKYIIIPFLAFSDPLPRVLRFLGSIVQWFVEGLTYTSIHPPLLSPPSKALSCILMAPSSLPLTSGDLSNLPQVAMRRYKDIMKY